MSRAVYSSPTLINTPWDSVASPPSNVWRICRLFKSVCADGSSQIVYYHAGVGSSGSKLDSVTGGDFGVGLDTVS